MRHGLPFLKTVLSKFSLEILPGVLASVVGGYLLTQWHMGSSTPAVDAAQTEIAKLKLEEKQEREQELAFVRDLLDANKAGSDNVASRYYVPVRPVPRAESGKPLANGVASVASAKPRAEKVAAHGTRPVPASAAPVMALPPLPAPTVVTANTAAHPETRDAEVLPPVVVAARVPEVGTAVVAPLQALTPPSAPAPRKRGFLAAAGSTVSVAIGETANAVGDAANWTIDLPGRALAAGSRLIGGAPQTGPKLLDAAY